MNVKKKLSHTFLNHSMNNDEIVLDNFFTVLPRGVHENLFAEEAARMFHDVDPYQHCRSYFQSRPESNPLDQMLYMD